MSGVCLQLRLVYVCTNLTQNCLCDRDSLTCAMYTLEENSSPKKVERFDTFIPHAVYIINNNYACQGFFFLIFGVH